MGLAAKKFAAEYTETRIPEALKELEKTTEGATKKLTVDFDWKSFGDDQAAIDGAWSCWQQALQGIEGVCADKIGRKAIQDQLKKVKIVNVTKDGPAVVTYKGGTLTYTQYFAGSTNSSAGWTAVQKVLEDNLD